MKAKQILLFMTLSTILLGLLTGCGANNPQGSIPDSVPDNTSAATLLSAEEDTRLKEDMQKDIDTILNTETEIIHSDTYIPGETYTGNAYYVSADGDDNNDGLTPETAWQSVAKKPGKPAAAPGWRWCYSRARLPALRRLLPSLPWWFPPRC